MTRCQKNLFSHVTYNPDQGGWSYTPPDLQPPTGVAVIYGGGLLSLALKGAGIWGLYARKLLAKSKCFNNHRNSHKFLCFLTNSSE